MISHLSFDKIHKSRVPQDIESHSNDSIKIHVETLEIILHWLSLYILAEERLHHLLENSTSKNITEN
jgi:hypothetical protein